ncbi:MULTISPECIES: hypothetical protein [Streptomyces]|uniref:Uncharacterized protein n=1 Tax=Streptomyces lonegramiae TaxID=3075524 RepID=A0ABU2XNT0_9ACTN|nr:hypothetical protein [Streptomyces sp. DSM 41529]MDT0547181.1 hypothetical protein [Streptomyces sp. DSM 41529]
MSDSDGAAAKELHPVKAKEHVRKLSSDVFDMVRLQGKVSPAGPATMPSRKGERDYFVLHAWSISHLSDRELTRGFYRLREELPKEGWRITDFGHANSTDRQLQIEAVHKKDEYSLTAELAVSSSGENAHASASKKGRIVFYVGSPTYRTPKGVDRDNY